MIVFSHWDVRMPLALMSRPRFCFSLMSVSYYSNINSTLYSVYVPILYIGSRNEYVFLHIFLSRIHQVIVHQASAQWRF